MIGDAQDMLARLKSVLPARWFGEVSPLLDAVLAGLADGWTWLHAMLATVRAQTRIGTASGSALDMIAEDFFGPRIRRRAAQGDGAFRTTILGELLRERATRPALRGALIDLTGRVPIIFEPRRPGDTGGWGVACGYGVAGGGRSLLLRQQCFVTAYRPLGSGIAALNGCGGGSAGWGVGSAAYASLAMLQGQVTDADIRAAIVAVLPVNAVAWTRISN